MPSELVVLLDVVVCVELSAEGRTCVETDREDDVHVVDGWLGVVEDNNPSELRVMSK